MNHLHPGARWLFRVYGLRTFLPIMVFVSFFTIIMASTTHDQSINAMFGVMIGVIGLLILTAFISLIEIYARMSYNRYLYEVTHDGIKIERGIIWKKYSSIPYERIQNVDIQRGIIARMFGFSTVQIETAGQSGLGTGFYGIQFRNQKNRQYQSEGYLPAISLEGAEELRFYIMKQIKHRHAERSGI